jgi:hypothetical protein
VSLPELTPTAEDVYDALHPLAKEDEAHGYALAHFLSALALMFDEAADLARDDEDGRPGWAGLFFTDTVPARYLPYVAMFGGVAIPANLPEDAQRLRVRETDGKNRGTTAAMAGAARTTLTGTRTVYVTERHGGSRWRIAFATLASETPDPAATLRALKAQKPGGYKITHTVVTASDFQTLRDTHSDFADVRSTFSDYAEVATNPAKQ